MAAAVEIVEDGASPAPLVRAAQYVRMSTDHQRYSTENQSDAIAAYGAVSPTATRLQLGAAIPTRRGSSS